MPSSAGTLCSFWPAGCGFNVMRMSSATARILSAGRPLVERDGHAVEMRGAEHVALGKGEAEHAVVGRGVPIDEMVDNVAVRLERQHVTNDGYGAPDVLRHCLDLGQLLEVVDC